MTEDEQWASYLAYATALKTAAGTAPTTGGIVGRSITKGVDWVVKFWGRHKDKLIPHLTNLAIAALEALVAQQTNIDVVDPPGPM